MAQTLKQSIGAETAKRQPRAAKVPDGAFYVGVSRAKLYEEHKAGRIKFLKIDGMTLVEYAELDRWFEARSRPAAA
ncbi:hypothetical protein [uncultured Roseobacter sp.]|uniref:hypothetical protein n=1 Tax=uncultured Roseobacter sp. TaxID=114847 RepID=UPI002629AC86|nr:hypothetical protein [uncultured Roseobacter sp.]